jgi:amino acid transporter
MVLVPGIQESTLVNTIIVVVKLAVVISFLIFCSPHVKVTNWIPFIPPNTGDVGAYGWTSVFLPLATWLRLVAWLMMGLAIYFGYGYRHSHLNRRPSARDASGSQKLEKGARRKMLARKRRENE